MTTLTAPQSGHDLRSTYRQAKQAYAADPDNEQHRRALGWALANLLKEASGAPDASAGRVLRGLAVVAGFPMEETNTRWRESVLWSVNRFLLRVQPEQLSLADLAGLVSLGRLFVGPTPSLVRSVWWKALIRHAATGIDWLGLFAELGWDEGFRAEDEQPETFGEGKSISPLMERLLGVVCRQLLQTIPLTDELAAPWLKRLTESANQHPDWPFLPYYHARLLQQLNRPEEAMRVFLPFARRKKRDFWVWSLLTDLLPNATSEQLLACYARALTLNTPEPFLVKVRQRAASLLIQVDRWADARAEIDRLVQTRRENNWSIPVEVVQWTNDDRYTQVMASPLNEWSHALAAQADNLLCADLSLAVEQVVLVTGIDSSGNYCTVAIDGHTSGSFPSKKFRLNVSTGDRLLLQYTMVSKQGRQQLYVFSAQQTEAPCTQLQTRSLVGPLRIMPGKSIGFVGDIYVPAELLTGTATLADQLVAVKAVESWNNAKKKMGWRAFQITKDVVHL